MGRLKSLFNVLVESRNTYDVEEALVMTGVFFDAEPYPAGAYRNRTPLMHVIRHEGLDL